MKEKKIKRNTRKKQKAHEKMLFNHTMAGVVISTQVVAL